MAYQNVTFREITRKFGGNVIRPEAAPHVAVVLGNQTGSMCTGAMLALDVVLILARCLFQDGMKQENETTMRVLAGVADLAHLEDEPYQERSVYRLIIHPSFNITKDDPSFGFNDMALIELNSAFEETEAVAAARLSEDNSIIGYSDVPCTLAGYSAINPLTSEEDDDKLKLLEVVASKQCSCENSLAQEFGNKMKRWICLKSTEKGPGPCVGSAGAGLVCNGTLVGLNEGIIPFQDLDQCIYQHDPVVSCDAQHSLAVFLDICPFQRWISFNFVDISRGPINCSKASQSSTSFKILITFILICVVYIKTKK